MFVRFCSNCLVRGFALVLAISAHASHAQNAATTVAYSTPAGKIFPHSAVATALSQAPTLTWNIPAAANGVVDPSVVLTDAILNAQADVTGGFNYFPAVGTVVGNGGITVGLTFTPDDTAHYVPMTAHRQLVAASPGDQVFRFRHLLGSPGNPGSTDGVGATASFALPRGVVSDTNGNLYVADTYNHTIRKITSTGVVSTFAGMPGVAGSADGTGPAARFHGPHGIVLDQGGLLYVTDTGNGTIRKVAADGTVTTFAGKAGEFGAIDGSLTVARFTSPTELGIDASGNLFVADGYAIRKISSDGNVTTLAGSVSTTGALNGTGAAARFNTITALTVDASGNVLVADPVNGAIRKISAAGLVQTYVGILGQPGMPQVTYPHIGSLQFVYPTGIVFDSQGRLLVSDIGYIIAVSSPASWTTLVGHSYSGNVDGVGTAASAARAYGMSRDAQGNVWFVEDGTIRKIAPDATVTTIAGAALQDGWNDSISTGIARDSAGNIYFPRRFTVCRLSPTGAVDIIAGKENQVVVDSLANLAGLVFGPNNTLLALDGTVVRKIDSSLSWYAGSTTAGSVDGKGIAARFGNLAGVVADKNGNLYVTDNAYHNVRKIAPDLTVTTYAGVASYYSGGAVDGAANVARFNAPDGITIDRAGNLYVADTYNYTIRKIATDGSVSTFAGVAGQSGTVDGKGSVARFVLPYAITADASDNLFVADEGAIREITPDGTVTTVGGITGTVGNDDGVGANARFRNPTGLLIDPSGHLILIDPWNNSLVEGVPLTVPTTVWDPTLMLASDALSAHQLNATANVAGTFVYAPELGQVVGFGSHILTATFTPDDTSRYASVTVQTNVGNYDGTYFGGFGTGSGRWALKVHRDRTGTFMAYFPERHSVALTHVEIDATGTINAPSAEITLPSTGAFRSALALGASGQSGRVASAFTFVGQIAANGTISGQLAGLGLTLNGTLDSGTNASADIYYADAIGTSGATSYAIVGPSSQIVVVTISTTSVDGASGTLDARGSLTTTTATGAQVSLVINSQAQSILEVMTPAGSSAPVTYAGLSDSVEASKKLVNLSTRALGSTGDNVTIGGFGIAGSGQKKFLIRAVGPTLTSQGILPAEVMLDPTIELHDALNNNAIVATNDNWGDNADPAAITTASALVGAAAFTSADTKSSALLVPLSPGVYSFVVQGKASTSGVVLLEVYDAETSNTSSSLVNISARARATTGSGVTIGGFAVNGNAPKKLLVRGVGPTLVPQGIPAGAVLQDPVIEVHDALHNNAIVATNDNWTDNTNSSDITVTGARVGATPFLSTDQTSSALLLTLPPGVYTFVASSKNGTSGIVLIEVYDAD